MSCSQRKSAYIMYNKYINERQRRMLTAALNETSKKQTMSCDEISNYNVMKMEKSEFAWEFNMHIHRSPKFKGISTNLSWSLGLEYQDDPMICLHLESNPSRTVYVEYCFTVQSTCDSEKWIAPKERFLFSDKNRRTPYCRPEVLSLRDALRNDNFCTPPQLKYKISVIMNVQVDDSSPANSMNISRNLAPPPTSKYTSDLLSVLKNGDFSDLLIKVGDKQIKCHKCILSGRSSYFESMLKSGLSESKENVIQITDFNADTIEDMIIFLYTSKFGTQKLNADLIMELLRAADKYQIPDMKDVCEKYLLSAIDVASALNILLCADLCTAEKLKKTAIDFICKNLKDFSGTSQYEQLIDRPHLLMDLLVAKAASSSQ